MKNMLLENPEYKITKTGFGVWRSFMYPTGACFSEFKSHKTIFGLPLVHYTRGICPETGRRVIAKGIIGVGRIASGFIAIGQAAFGIIAIGQLAVGILLALGQAGIGICSVGQLAVGLAFGMGQFATGYACIAQFGFGKYVLAQAGFGEFVWSAKRKDPQALEYFKMLMERFL